MGLLALTLEHFQCNGPRLLTGDKLDYESVGLVLDFAGAAHLDLLVVGKD